MCGLFGAIKKRDGNLCLGKLKILGLYNVWRGEDSCGYYWDGNIDKGVDEMKRFDDYAAYNPLKRGDLDAGVFLGHTRKATVGIKDFVNAHPHQVEDYVQTHNGTLSNWRSLAALYNVNIEGIASDSMALAKIIKQTGFEVLGKYDGFAALAMTFTTDPKTVYLFHGAAKKTLADKEPIEERPLYYVDTPDGLYYSSMYNSLCFITDNQYEVHTLPHNKVFKVVEGVLQDEPVYTVDRTNANLYIPAPRTKEELARIEELKKKLKKKNGKGDNNNCKVVDFQDYTQPPLVWREAQPYEAYTAGNAYYWRGRYHKDNNTLLNGVYDIDRDGKIIAKGLVSDRPVDTYYFIRGMMIRDEKAYKFLLSTKPEVATSWEKNIAFIASPYTKYPVCLLSNEGSAAPASYMKFWYLDGKKARQSFEPKFTDRKYTIYEGELTCIQAAYSGEMIISSPNTQSPVSVVEGMETPVIVSGFKVNSQGDLFKALPTIITEDCTADLNSIFDNTTDATIQKNFLDRMTMENIVTMVRTWTETPIKDPTLVKLLPEPFLIYIDYIIMSIYELEQGVVEMSDGKVEKLTTDYLRDMIYKGYSLADTLHAEPDYAYLLKIGAVNQCFAQYDVDELAEMANRYDFIDFTYDPNLVCKNTPSLSKEITKTILDDDHPVENDDDSLEGTAVDEAIERMHAKFAGNVVNANNECKERIKLLLDQLNSMIAIADNFQQIDLSDSAQDLAFTLYQNASVLRGRIQEIAERNKYRDILQEVAKIKC